MRTTYTPIRLYRHVPFDIHEQQHCLCYRALQVQTVTIAATHQDEVQIITTAAPVIVGVQLMSTAADEGETVAGNFSLQFPEKQLVRCRV